MLFYLVFIIYNIVSVVVSPVSVINNIVVAAVVIVVVFLLWGSFGGKDFPSVCVN